MYPWVRALLGVTLVTLATAGLNACSAPWSSNATATPAPAATATPPQATATPAAASVATSPAPPPLPTIPPATPAPSPTATQIATPSVATPAPATPQRPGPIAGSATPPPATPATPLAGDLIVEDPERACAVALPPGFTPVSANPGSFAAADGRALLTLASLTANPDDTLDDLALPFVAAFIPLVTNYQQTIVTKQDDSLRIEFTGQIGAVGKGALYFRQYGRIACAVILFVADGAATPFDATLDLLIASLHGLKGVG